VHGALRQLGQQSEHPDPSKEIHFGEQSWDEMMFGFFDVAIPFDKNPMDIMRPKAPKKDTGAVE